MKQLTEYNRVSGYLNKIFDRLNETYFEGTLSKPIITIQSTPKAYGHVSVYEVWQSGDANRRELKFMLFRTKTSNTYPRHKRTFPPACAENRAGY